MLYFHTIRRLTLNNLVANCEVQNLSRRDLPQSFYINGNSISLKVSFPISATNVKSPSTSDRVLFVCHVCSQHFTMCLAFYVRLRPFICWGKIKLLNGYNKMSFFHRHPQASTTISSYCLSTTFSLLSKYNMEIPESFVGAQQTFGTARLSIELTSVCMIA